MGDKHELVQERWWEGGSGPQPEPRASSAFRGSREGTQQEGLGGRSQDSGIKWLAAQLVILGFIF